MKTLKALCMTVLVFLGLHDLRAAVVVSDLSDAEYSHLVATSVISWKVDMVAGFPSTSTIEITVGNQTTSHNWSIPEQIEVDYDLAGNLNVRAGSTVLITQPTVNFNAILIRIRDANFWGEKTELKNTVFNTINVRNLSADETTTSAVGYDQVLITGIGNAPEFTLSSQFYKGEFSVLDDSQLIITGIIIPEPSSIFLIALSSMIFLRRRR